MKRIVRIGAICSAGLSIVFGGLSAAPAAELGGVAHFRVSPEDHIAARQFCLTAVHRENEAEKLTEERFVQLAHACSMGNFNRVFTELGADSREGLVVHKGANGLEVIHEWERDVRSAIAKAPHLELK